MGEWILVFALYGGMGRDAVSVASVPGFLLRDACVIAGKEISEGMKDAAPYRVWFACVSRTGK